MGETSSERKQHSGLIGFLRRLVKEKPLGTVGLVIVLLLLFFGIFANFLAPYGMNQSNVVDRLAPPSAKYLMGTDNLGRDILSRVIYGARISLNVGLSATGVSLIVFLTIGILSGYIGGKFDLIVQRFVDSIMSIPGLILLMVIMSIVGVGFGADNRCGGGLDGHRGFQDSPRGGDQHQRGSLCPGGDRHWLSYS